MTFAVRVLAVALAFLCGAAGMASARPFTARDLASLERLSDPQVSPDGRFVAYDVGTVDFEANRASHAIWLADLRQPDAAPRRLAASGADAIDPQWSPDGRFLYFLSGRSGLDQIWRTDIAGLRATQVTRLPLDVETFRPSPDGRRLVLAMAVFPDAEAPRATLARQDAVKSRKSTGVLYQGIFVRHWDAWADGRRNHLFALGLGADGAATGAAVPLMSGFDGDSPSRPFGQDDDFTISPDGGTVIFSARVAGRSEPWSTNFDLWAVPIGGAVPPRNLTADNPAADVQPVFSPDGHTLAWRAQKRAGFESDRFGIWVMDLASGARREVDPGWDHSAEEIAWSADGKSLLAVADDVGQTRLFSIDVRQGDVTSLTGDGHVSDLSVGGGAVGYTQEALDVPPRIVARLDGASRTVAEVSGGLSDIRFSAFEPFTFAGWNGETVRGYVVQPSGYEPGRKFPVVLLVHGGPQGSFGDAWNWRWNPQVWAGWGFAVVMIDFHGSTGYGQAFTDSISGHWGDRPLEDLQKGWVAALAKFAFLDGDRACAAGGSYGGYMVYWMAGVWNAPWRCLIAHDGVFDNPMMGYATDELWFSEWENGGLPWLDPAGYARFDPAAHVANWTKPMLVIHSALDYRVPIDQGIAAFTALQRKGVPSEFLTFPDENHWVIAPQNSVQWHDAIEAWLKRWTR